MTLFAISAIELLYDDVFAYWLSRVWFTSLCVVVYSTVFGPVDSMGPSEVRQYLYCLRPQPDVAADVRQMKNVTLIGKLDIVWKTNMAERGRLQTSPLQRMVSAMHYFACSAFRFQTNSVQFLTEVMLCQEAMLPTITLVMCQISVRI